MVHIHPFWLRFCLQALFDLPDSILLVSRPKIPKRTENQQFYQILNLPVSPFLGFGALGVGVYLETYSKPEISADAAPFFVPTQPPLGLPFLNQIGITRLPRALLLPILLFLESLGILGSLLFLSRIPRVPFVASLESLGIPRVLFFPFCSP